MKSCTHFYYFTHFCNAVLGPENLRDHKRAVHSPHYMFSSVIALFIVDRVYWTVILEVATHARCCDVYRRRTLPRQG